MVDEVTEIASKTGSVVKIVGDVKAAVKDADIVYTDTWMSYGIKPSEEAKRKEALAPFQVCIVTTTHA